MQVEVPPYYSIDRCPGAVFGVCYRYDSRVREDRRQVLLPSRESSHAAHPVDEDLPYGYEQQINAWTRRDSICQV